MSADTDLTEQLNQSRAQREEAERLRREAERLAEQAAELERTARDLAAQRPRKADQVLRSD